MCSAGRLPHEHKSEIPRSTLNRWKYDDFSRYYDTPLGRFVTNYSGLAKNATEYPNFYFAVDSLVCTYQKLVNQVENVKEIVRDNKEIVVNTILNFRDTLSIDKAVKFFDISKSTFHNWVIETKVKCQKSFSKKCNKLYPGQILPDEVKAIKIALRNPKTLHWSIKSVYYHSIRNKTISVSENTFYKINRLLEIRTPANSKVRKKPIKKGFRATIPNHTWHADITVFKTLDNVKHYIYFVMDNYSRNILSYRVANRVSGEIRAETLEEAYKKALRLGKPLNVNLIVDGGTENHNLHVHDFINQGKININKLTALKDWLYSNSMVESINKTVKYRYLYPRDIRDLKHLLRTMRYFINDYNNIKPHGSLEGLTPFEAWTGYKLPNDYRTSVIKAAKARRLRYNKENRCESCTILW